LRIEGTVIATGEAALPLRKWYSNTEQRFQVHFHLEEKAIKLLEDSLSKEYLNGVLAFSGNAECADHGNLWRGQFVEQQINFEISKTDCVNRILKRVGWGEYFFLGYRIPKVSSGPDGGAIARLLSEMHEKYALGGDREVFAPAYDAIEPFYSRRDSVVANMPDQAKAGAARELIETIHRFANGGRHRPEGQKERGGFEVNRNDAELVRGLVTHLVAYLSRLEHFGVSS
jgi:hypothetical protein